MSAPPLAQLAVSERLVNDLIYRAHQATLANREAVGLVIAPMDAANDPQGWSAWPMLNESPEPERTFFVSEDSLALNWHMVQDSGYGVMAFYHSHLHRAANPSATDIANAWCPRQFIVFDGARHRDSAVKLWWIDDGAAVQIPLVEV